MIIVNMNIPSDVLIAVYTTYDIVSGAWLTTTPRVLSVLIDDNISTR